MGYTEFETLLKQTTGLDAASIGAAAIERAVQARVSACGMDDAHRYWDLVNTSRAELQALIETVIVPETWFFRDREAFSALARIAREKYLATPAAGNLRLLSVPCSSGEEPYSMAMALLDAGFLPDRYSIDAFDISNQALTRARLGVYGKNSFRGAELSFRERYFQSMVDGERIKESVRQQVRFQHGNLFAPEFLANAAPYDMIFCRNLLIYFDRATQDRAIGILRDHLAREGVLFVGPSETTLLLSHDFVSAKLPLAFAFHRGSADSRAAAPVPIERVRKRAAPSNVAPAAPVRKPALASSAPKAEVVRKIQAKPAPVEDKGMEEATRLADQGHLAEAAKSCEDHIQKHGPTAPAFHLLGLIRSATGSLAEAERYYRQALYLDPSHHGGLVHLALLLEQRGDAAGAQNMRDRISRLKQKSTK